MFSGLVYFFFFFFNVCLCVVPLKTNTPPFFQLLNILMIIVSIVNLVVSTSPDLWDRPYSQNLGIFIVDTLTVAFFTFDYLVRFFTAPSMWKYFIDIFNIFDLCVIVPYVVTQILESFGRNAAAIQVLYVLKLLRIVRVFRFFRLGRYSGLLNSTLHAFRRSADALVIWCILMATALVLDATLMFFAEQTWEVFNSTSREWIYDEGLLIGRRSPFQSIWHCFWWALTTLSYVGYGDEVPQSPLGRTVFLLTVVTAILSFLVPISIVLSRVNAEAARYQEVKSAARLRDYSHSELLIKVFQMSQELNSRMGEMRKTQKTLGILLYKLGKTAMYGSRPSNSSGNNNNNNGNSTNNNAETGDLGLSAGAARMFAQTQFSPMTNNDGDDDDDDFREDRVEDL